MIPLLGYNSNHCGGSMVLYQYVSNRSLYITLNTLNLPQQLWDLFADQCHFSFQFYHLLSMVPLFSKSTDSKSEVLPCTSEHITTFKIHSFTTTAAK